MKYKTPPLPKLKSQTSEMKINIDTKGYNTHPVNVINSTSYISRNTAVPYYENIDTSMLENGNYGLDDIPDLDGETDIISAGKLRINYLKEMQRIQASVEFENYRMTGSLLSQILKNQWLIIEEPIFHPP